MVYIGCIDDDLYQICNNISTLLGYNLIHYNGLSEPPLPPLPPPLLLETGSIPINNCDTHIILTNLSYLNLIQMENIASALIVVGGVNNDTNSTDFRWPEHIPILLITASNMNFSYNNMAPYKHVTMVGDNLDSVEGYVWSHFSLWKSTSPVVACVFDVGGVLLQGRPVEIAPNVFEGRSDANQLGELFHEFYHQPLWKGLDDGRFTIEDVLKEDTSPICKEDLRTWWDSFPRWMRPLPVVPSVAALSAKGVPLFILSNFAESSFKRVCELYPEVFEAITWQEKVVSWKTRVNKPNKAMFDALKEALLARGITQFDHVLFFDDTLENVKASVLFGFAAFCPEANVGGPSIIDVLKRKKLL